MYTGFEYSSTWNPIFSPGNSHGTLHNGTLELLVKETLSFVVVLLGSILAVKYFGVFFLIREGPSLAL
jgi:hypothetical protein